MNAQNPKKNVSGAGSPWWGRGGNGFTWRYVAAITVGLIAAWLWAGYRYAEQIQELSYTEFKQEVRAGNVSEVTLRGNQIAGVLAKDAKGQTPTAPEGGEQATPSLSEGAPVPPSRQFFSRLPPMDDPDLMPLLEKNGVTVRALDPDPPWWMRLLVGALPWILLIGLFFYISYRMQQRMMSGSGSGGGLFGIGRSRAKRVEKEESEFGYDDVAGLENAKRDLREVVEYLKDPDRYRALGAATPRGVLLMGPPGTGKTLLAKAVAGEADAAFFSVSGSEFIEMFVGVGASRVRNMFEDAKKESSAIIFIDEIDAIGRTRGAGLGGGHDEREQTLNQILSEMDGFAAHESVVVLAATNRPDVLDPALTRPGRFDRKITLELPGKEARRRILEVHTREVPLADDVDLELVAARTVGFSGADIMNLVNEAALLSGRRDSDKVDMKAFHDARDKLVLGAERETLLSDEDKRVVAYHESGHALMAYLCPTADPLDKVTIVPRGRALGATEQLPEEERYNVQEGYLRDRISVMLAGRVAERVIFGEVSSGAENDLQQATRIARRMVARWGMSDRLGAVSYRFGEEHVFLGREMTQSRDFSEHTAKVIDDEIRGLIERLEERVEYELNEHRAALEKLAEALLERETIDADEIDKLFREAGAEAGAAADPHDTGDMAEKKRASA